LAPNRLLTTSGESVGKANAARDQYSRVWIVIAIIIGLGAFVWLHPECRPYWLKEHPQWVKERSSDPHSLTRLLLLQFAQVNSPKVLRVRVSSRGS